MRLDYALFLSFKAQSGEFDVVFYGVQAIELIAGALNIGLLGLNLRDGLRASGRIRRDVTGAEFKPSSPADTSWR